MRILIDTNILIHLEDEKIIDEPFSKFYQLAVENKCDIFYHPDCEKDIANDKNEPRRKIILSKLRKYSALPKPSIPNIDFTEIVEAKKSNDHIDNNQLYQVYAGFVDLFVTEDNGIIQKANKLGISDKVKSIEAAKNILEGRYKVSLPGHPIVENIYVKEIEDQLQNSFFDSLRADYIGFDKWFIDKCVKKDRKCYIIRSEVDLYAILIYNLEIVENHKLPGIYEKALKMATLKVSDDAVGNKFGELFLNKMFSYCIENRIHYLYLTVFPKQKELIGLLTAFGFTRMNMENGELIMIKKLDKSVINDAYNSISNHPFYSDKEKITKVVVPIQPKYYKTLFKDSKLRPAELFDKSFENSVEIEGNTIRKAYLCNAPIKKLQAGDLLFFYSSGESKVIEAFGILESFDEMDSLEEIKSIVKKRTVYTNADIEEMFNKKQKIKVLLFRLIDYLDKPITFKEIKQLDCSKNNFQTITVMQETDYIYLKKKGYFNECYIIN